MMSSAGAHVFLQVWNAPSGQLKEIVNVARFLPVHLVQLSLVVFYVRWL
jgi:hypothetical protein